MSRIQFFCPVIQSYVQLPGFPALLEGIWVEELVEHLMNQAKPTRRVLLCWVALTMLFLQMIHKGLKGSRIIHENLRMLGKCFMPLFCRQPRKYLKFLGTDRTFVGTQVGV